MAESNNNYHFSLHQVRWRPVIWGIALQVIFAFVILRTTHGYLAFKFIGDQVTVFLDYTNQGSKFVFGDDYEKHTIAFKVSSSRIEAPRSADED